MTAWRNKGIRKSKRRAIFIRARRMRARRKLATPAYLLDQLDKEMDRSFKPKKRPVRLVKWLRLLMNADRVDARLKQVRYWRDKHGTR